MGQFLSDIFDSLLDLTNLSWPVKLFFSIVVFAVLLFVFRDSF